MWCGLFHFYDLPHKDTQHKFPSHVFLHIIVICNLMVDLAIYFLGFSFCAAAHARQLPDWSVSTMQLADKHAVKMIEFAKTCAKYNGQSMHAGHHERDE
jgi:hypothetical protein